MASSTHEAERDDPELAELRYDSRRTQARRLFGGGLAIVLAGLIALAGFFLPAFRDAPLVQYRVASLLVILIGVVTAAVGVAVRLSTRRGPPRVPPARARR